MKKNFSHTAKVSNLFEAKEKSHYRKAKGALYTHLKGLFHPAFLARVVSWFPFVVAIFMGHENGGKQRLAKRRHVQGMLDETIPLI